MSELFLTLDNTNTVPYVFHVCTFQIIDIIFSLY